MRQPNIQAVRRAREVRLRKSWQEQRSEAIMREQIEHCYKVFTPAQIAAAKAKS